MATAPVLVLAPVYKEVLEDMCFYCTQEGNPEVEGDYEISVIIPEIWEMNRYTLDELREAGIPSDRMASYIYGNKQSMLNRLACEDHTSICEYCEDHYVQPHDSDQIRDIPEDKRPYAYQTMAQVSWQFSDRICYNCHDNVSLCDRCEDFTSSDDCRYTSNGYNYCDSCADAIGLYYCDECDDYHDEPCEYSDSRLIHDYSYKPDPVFRYTEADGDLSRRNARQGKVFMGFELEVEAPSGEYRENGATLVCDELGEDYIYLKNDGSLNNGFEIVSHPATLAFHKTRKFEVLTQLAQEHNYRSWNAGTCGLHVHISRTAFDSPSHIWKFAHLVANNKREMVKLAGRESDRWATFDGIRSTIGAKAKGATYVNRYEALNFQNSNTIELRFFRGTLSIPRVFSALELTDAMTEYTRTLTANDVIRGGLEFAKFAEWASDRPQYPNLTSFLVKFDLIPTNNTQPIL